MWITQCFPYLKSCQVVADGTLSFAQDGVLAYPRIIPFSLVTRKVLFIPRICRRCSFASAAVAMLTSFFLALFSKKSLHVTNHRLFQNQIKLAGWLALKQILPKSMKRGKLRRHRENFLLD